MTEKKETGEFLTERQVAQMLGFSQRTLANWRKVKKGPPWVLLADRSVRYSKIALNKWIESRISQSPT